MVEEANMVGLGVSKMGRETAVATAQEINALQAQITALEAAVRYLREDARRAKLSVMEVGNLDWLNEPLVSPKTASIKQRDLVVSEGKDLLGELLNLCGDSKVFELSKEPGNRLAWRSFKSTPGYHVAAQREIGRASCRERVF